MFRHGRNRQNRYFKFNSVLSPAGRSEAGAVTLGSTHSGFMLRHSHITSSARCCPRLISSALSCLGVAVSPRQNKSASTLPSLKKPDDKKGRSAFASDIFSDAERLISRD